MLPATLMHIPYDILKRIQKVVYKFIWVKSKDKVKRSKLCQDISSGGLNMLDIPSFLNSLLASWVPKIQEADPNRNNWVQLPKLLLNKLDIDGIGFRYNFDENVLFPEVNKLNTFYREVIKSYNKAFVSDFTHFKDTILDQPLWGNKYITDNMQVGYTYLVSSNISPFLIPSLYILTRLYS